jgi:HPt (histidine-containing phosphotransfer) domain-containing protein
MSTSSVMTFAGPQPMRSVIDDDHLGRMTLGDAGLEREVLEIFVRQVGLLLQRIAGAEPALAAATAHTLKGSARSVGAWRVAEAAEQVEEAAGRRAGDQAMTAATAELDAAGREVCAAIGERLGRRSGEGLGAHVASASSVRLRDH